MWDYDFGAAPKLVTLTVDGREIDAVAEVSKQGFTYVFDRVTGAEIWRGATPFPTNGNPMTYRTRTGR
ncbi:MAG: hypothetical protein J4G09_01665 [Proteobacteria bacterium]|nr:hypothetical protein [Pseudomonadota bacterium]